MENISSPAALAVASQSDQELEGDVRPRVPSPHTPLQQRAMRPKWYSKPHAPMDELFWRVWTAADSAGVEVQHLLSEYHHARVRQVRRLEQALSALQTPAEQEGAPELPGAAERPV